MPCSMKLRMQRMSQRWFWPRPSTHLDLLPGSNDFPRDVFCPDWFCPKRSQRGQWDFQRMRSNRNHWGKQRVISRPRSFQQSGRFSAENAFSRHLCVFVKRIAVPGPSGTMWELWVCESFGSPLKKNPWSSSGGALSATVFFGEGTGDKDFLCRSHLCRRFFFLPLFPPHPPTSESGLWGPFITSTNREINKMKEHRSIYKTPKVRTTNMHGGKHEPSLSSHDTTRSHTKGGEALRANLRQHAANLPDTAGFVQTFLFFFPEMFITLKSWKMPNHTNIWGHQIATIYGENLKIPNHNRGQRMMHPTSPAVACPPGKLQLVSSQCWKPRKKSDKFNPLKCEWLPTKCCSLPHSPTDFQFWKKFLSRMRQFTTWHDLLLTPSQLHNWTWRTFLTKKKSATEKCSGLAKSERWFWLFCAHALHFCHSTAHFTFTFFVAVIFPAGLRGKHSHLPYLTISRYTEEQQPLPTPVSNGRILNTKARDHRTTLL